jgi:pheromone shutdown protein TraB
METKAKGRTTIRTAAVCFLAAAVFEVLDITAPVPLLGGIRSGAAAMGYHLIFTAVFFAMGFGLWSGKPWGYDVVLAGTALYSIDKVQMLLARQTFSDYIMQQFTTPTTREILSLVPKEQVLQLLTLVYLVLILCGWGFAFYIHLRRSYFTQKI